MRNISIQSEMTQLHSSELFNVPWLDDQPLNRPTYSLETLFSFLTASWLLQLQYPSPDISTKKVIDFASFNQFQIKNGVGKRIVINK